MSGVLSRARADAAAVRAIRAVRRARGATLSAGDVSYRIYLAIMLTIIVVAPGVRLGVLGAAPVLPELVREPGAVAALLTAATAGVVLLGGRLGPARAGLPQLDLLFPSPIPRWRLLAPAVARFLLAAAGLGALLGGVWAVSSALRSPLPLALASGVILAGVCTCVLGIGALLVGQSGIRARTILASALALLAVAQLTLGPLADPWSATARLLEMSVLPAGSVEVVAVHVPTLLAVLAVPVAAALAVVCGAVPFAARLPRDVLREQAVNWDAASALALTGDPTAALARFGAPVRHGRGLRLRSTGSLIRVLMRRDLLGLVRAPGRTLAGLGGVCAAGAVWAAAVQPGLGIGGAAILGAVAALLGSLGAQPLCRGIVTAAGGAGSPALLPLSPAVLLAAHALVPALVCVVLACGGAAAAILISGGAALGFGGLLAVWTAPALACAIVLLRAAAALKGTIPLRLLAPVPTPLGDVSAVNVFLWSVDGPLVALLVGGVLAAGTATGSPLLGVAAAVLVLVSLTGWAYSRLRPSLSG